MIAKDRCLVQSQASNLHGRVLEVKEGAQDGRFFSCAHVEPMATFHFLRNLMNGCSELGDTHW